MGINGKEAPGLAGPSIGLIYGQGEGLATGFAVSAESRLTQRRADGSVVGSYSTQEMSALLRYHNVDDGVLATGGMYRTLGGERIDA